MGLTMYINFALVQGVRERKANQKNVDQNGAILFSFIILLWMELFYSIYFINILLESEATHELSFDVSYRLPKQEKVYRRLFLLV